ncbi:unnamed protein product [Blepharisma stoltei]|uniref:Uncharacterized protein n=1 Tax=Blepharisma stoltei TaxID=1481888 RepID=A0AAU9J3F1_9CILI|nr:unnamed protein product [Blepharisma stoltei]
MRALKVIYFRPKVKVQLSTSKLLIYIQKRSTKSKRSKTHKLYYIMAKLLASISIATAYYISISDYFSPILLRSWLFLLCYRPIVLSCLIFLHLRFFIQNQVFENFADLIKQKLHENTLYGVSRQP